MSLFLCSVIYEFQQLQLGSSTSHLHQPVSPHIHGFIQAPSDLGVLMVLV